MKNNIASKKQMNRGRIGRPTKPAGLTIERILLAVAVLFFSSPLAAHAADTCSLLTNQQISGVTHDPVNQPPGSGPNSCIWSGKNSTIYIGIRDGASWSTSKAAFQKYGQIQAVSGVGDDAFFESPADPHPTLFASKGGHFINIRVNVSNFSTDQNKAAMKALANDALAHF